MKSKGEKTPIWTLPNRLSLVRILLIPVIVLLISSQKENLLFASSILFIIAGITDGLDGWIARRMSMTTRLGVLLDPIADKLLVSSVLIALTYYHLVPLWITIILVGRELVINGLRSFYAMEGITIYPSFSGKFKTALQIVGIACILFGTPLRMAGLVIMFGALFFSLYSAVGYIVVMFRPAPAGDESDRSVVTGQR